MCIWKEGWRYKDEINYFTSLGLKSPSGRQYRVTLKTPIPLAMKEFTCRCLSLPIRGVWLDDLGQGCRATSLSLSLSQEEGEGGRDDTKFPALVQRQGPAHRQTETHQENSAIAKQTDHKPQTSATLPSAGFCPRKPASQINRANSGKLF